MLAVLSNKKPLPIGKMRFNCGQLRRECPNSSEFWTFFIQITEGCHLDWFFDAAE